MNKVNFPNSNNTTITMAAVIKEMDPNYWAVGKVKSLVGFRPPDQG